MYPVIHAAPAGLDGAVGVALAGAVVTKSQGQKDLRLVICDLRSLILSVRQFPMHRVVVIWLY
jgi:hypothetical protein